ncbi:PX domain-containing protein [Tremella mesenterica]|uniref:PX domain-containing protein n=1 Tax=Tremella mesenterica TaxID=5217 RepID=A0A4Q1BWL0_TREME|nr:PX domain-containing protein [Tremella mesenterica]
MSNIDPKSLPYQPRRRKSTRPDRPLPPPPDEDAAAINAVDLSQGFTSPPSPPPPVPTRDLPPPPSSIGAQSSASHLLPYHSSLPVTDQFLPPLTLTPLRAHYLKKTLVNLQIYHELDLLTDPVLGANALGLLGDPFVLPEAVKQMAKARLPSAADSDSVGDLPLMRFLFHQFLLPFPFLATAPPTFWSAKVQPFLSSFLASTGVSTRSQLSPAEKEAAESMMTKEEKKEEADKVKLWAKVEKHLALMIGVGIKLVGGEEVVRIGQAELRRLEAQQQARRRRWIERQRADMEKMDGYVTGDPSLGGAPPPPGGVDVGFDVNVIGVRMVTEKGRVRNRHHEEFLIRTRRNGFQDVFVSRRYGDFKRLADELRIAFPDYQLPPPPPKDKTVTVTSPTASPSYNPLRSWYTSSPNPANPPSGRASPTIADTASVNSTASPTPLSREKNRLTLRAYLQGIISLPLIIDSPILRSFLLSGPTTLTPSEALDSQRRLEADAVREEGRRRFRLEAEKRIEALREGLALFKGDVLAKEGGLKKVFDIVRRVEKVEDLPKAEASVLEWGRISLAATIFNIFVASDTASDTLASLKRLHGLMPYFVLKGILRISNPMAMIRGILDLFLARPFGGQSLLQKMFSQSLTEDIRLIAEDIQTVMDKIDDPVLCQKIQQYTDAPYDIQELFRKDAAMEGVDLLVVILRSPDMPTLSRPQLQRAYRASRAWKSYKLAQAELDDSDDDLGPEDEDAWLFEDLMTLLRLCMRKREKEQLLALIFEGTTAELLKDIITIFYTPLAQVYKAASIADSLSDLQSFLNDMIRTVEQVEELSQEDPQRTVQTFIDLVQRHEQSFYTFVHNVHSKGQGLFDSLMSWIELFLNYARDGLPQPIDLEIILPHGGDTRRVIMDEVDAVAQYHYKLKIAHEEKVRRRFQRSEGQTDEEAALIDSVMVSLNISETAVGDAGEIADEEESDDSDLDQGDDTQSETSSLSHKFEQVKLSNPPPPINQVRGILSPAIHDPLLSPIKEKERQRRGSGGSGRSSLEKIRSSLDIRRKITQEGKELPPTPSTARGHGHGHSPVQPTGQTQRKKGRKRRTPVETLQPPETKAVEELRPLFVEVLRPLLRVQPMRP